MIRAQLMVKTGKTKILIPDLGLRDSILSGAVTEILAIHSWSEFGEKRNDTCGDPHVEQAGCRTRIWDRGDDRTGQQSVPRVIVRERANEAWRRQVTEPLVVAEEKSSILADRPAERTAKLIASERRPGSIEVVQRIEYGITMEFVRGTMKLVRA